MCPSRHLSHSCIHSVAEQIFFWRVLCAPGTGLAIVYRAVNKANTITAALMGAQRPAGKACTEDARK